MRRLCQARHLLYIALLLLAVPLTAQGQSEDRHPGYRRYFFAQDSLAYADTSQSFYPSSLSFLQHLQPTSAGIYLDGHTTQHAYYAGVAQAQRRYRAAAKGMRNVAGFTLCGSASYSRDNQFGLSRILSPTSGRFWPYVLSDTTSCTLWGEQYAVACGASYPILRSLSVGIQGAYDGQLYYSREDPRVKNILSAITAGLSLSWLHPRLGIFSLAAHTLRDIQEVNFTVYKVGSKQLVYYLRPFGAINHRYSKAVDGGGCRHQQWQWRAGLQWVHTKHDMKLGILFSRNDLAQQASEPGAVPAEIRMYSLAPYAHLSLPHRVLGMHLWLDGILQLHQQRAVERVYEYVQAMEDLIAMNAELLTVREGFSSRQAELHLRLQTLRAFPSISLQGGFGYSYSHRDEQTSIRALGMRTAQQGANANIALRYSLCNRALLAQTALRWHEQFLRLQRYHLAADSPVAQLYTDRANRLLGLARRVELSQSLDCIPQSWKGQGVRLASTLSLLYWDKATPPNLAFTLGIEYHF